ncbi:hypothetical protein F8M41_019185 [Gigaspora margarita]|uniref:Uncharacterized protein n=1 Tax=Gigaspora margarita TaxID=4874 RepID=A0A8H4EU36_GIGMA|nr:hypothetical protein F8M41_019185 [Gigaspora margarita]
MSNENQPSLSSNSNHVVEITKNEPHNGKKISKIVLSLNMRYAATWSKKDQSICGWQIIDDFAFEFEYSAGIQELYEEFYSKHSKALSNKELIVHPQLEAISNNKLVVINFVSKFKKETEEVSKNIFDLVKKKEIKLESLENLIFSDFHLPFYVINNKDDLAIHMPIKSFNKIHATIFIFYSKDLHDHYWQSKKTINCGTMGEIRAYHSTDNGKLFILDACGLLTQWDLYTLRFEKQYQLEWDKIWITYGLEEKFYIFNNNFTLFAICLQAFDYLFINVYLTENAIPLSCKYERHNNRLSHLEFISFDEGERLLLFFEDMIEIRDPYCLDHCIKVSNLCEKFLAEINGKENMQNADLYIIRNENMYIILEGRIFVQKFSKKQWIDFLRNKLHDYNEIKFLPSKLQIKKFLQGILDENINKSDNEFINRKDVEKPYKGLLIE